MAEEKTVDRTELRQIATYQKVILVCLLVYIGLYASNFLIPADIPRLPLFIALGIASLTATVFVFLLATRTSGTGMGIVLGILTLIPCIGLIVLLVVNSKATKTLQANGIKVGLLGASMSDLK